MKLIIKLLLAPITIMLTLCSWLCAGLLMMSGWIFGIASTLVSILAVAVLLTGAVKNGIILFVIAFLISPCGIPKLLAHIIGAMSGLASAIRTM